MRVPLWPQRAAIGNRHAVQRRGATDRPCCCHTRIQRIVERFSRGSRRNTAASASRFRIVRRIRVEFSVYANEFCSGISGVCTRDVIDLPGASLVNRWVVSFLVGEALFVG